MPGAPLKRAVLLLPLVYALYFHGLSGFGLVGPDEPRYASIAREMAASGDWVTPRLWGEPWFEKPALLYWMSALGFRAGLGPELAPRLPVAALSVAFLCLFWWALRREFTPRAAWFATAVLGTCAGWLGFSAVGATDLPLAATFSAAIVLALPWIGRDDPRRLPYASACLGAAVLAKGLVPLVLVAPLLWMGRRRWRDLAGARVLGPFLAVAAPWYILCWMRNGRAFIDEFFLEHHFSRFTSGALMHGQPWWFYVPVLLAGMLPWTPLMALLPGADLWKDRRTRLLLGIAVWGFAFFSASTNKLPGYVLPLVPSIAALCGLALDRARHARAALAACALLLTAYMAGAQLLAPSLASGLSRAARPGPDWTWTLPLAAAAGVWLLESWKRRGDALLLAVAGTAGCVLLLKTTTYPVVDRTVSVRSQWGQVAPVRDRVCLDEGLHRAFRYGLNYYSVQPIPECGGSGRPLRLLRAPGGGLLIEPAPVPAGRVRRPSSDTTARLP